MKIMVQIYIGLASRKERSEIMAIVIERVMKVKKVDRPWLTKDTKVVFTLIRGEMTINGKIICVHHRIEGYAADASTGNRVGKVYTTPNLSDQKAKASILFDRLVSCREVVWPNELEQLNHDYSYIPDSTLKKKLNGKLFNALDIRRQINRTRRSRNNEFGI